MSGLPKQTVAVAFTGGVDTKTDFKSLPRTKLTRLNNGVFVSPGRIKKRNGFSVLSSSLLGGGSLGTGTMLTTRAGELIMADSANLYSWDAAGSVWANKGLLRSVTATSAPLALNAYTIVGYDVAIGGSIQLAVYEQWTKFGQTYIGLGYVAIDTATGNTVANGTISGGGGGVTNCICPKVLYANGNFLIFYINNSDNTIRLSQIAATAPQTVASDAALTSGAGASALCTFGAITKKRYDVCIGGTNVYLVFNNNVGGGPSTNGTTTFQMTQAAPATVANTFTHVTTDSAMVCIFYDGSVQSSGPGPVVGWLTSFAGNQSVVYESLNATVTSSRSTGTVEATGLVGFSNISGINVNGSSSILYRFFYTFEASNAAGKIDNSYIRTNTVTGAGFTVGSSSVLARSVLAVSKPFMQSDGANNNSYLPVTFDTSGRSSLNASGTLAQSVFQTTYFVIGGGDTPAGAAVVARMFPGTAGGVYNNSSSVGGVQRMMPETVQPASNQWTFAGLNAYALQSTSSATTFQSSLVAATLNFNDSTNGYSRAQLGNALHIGSAAMQMYDGGGAPVEHGFHYYPYAISNSNAGGGSIAAGTYLYTAVYRWTDAYGQVHRSATAVALSVTCGAASTNTLTCPTLRLTAKTGSRPVVVEFYRTQASGTTFYQLGVTTNDPTVDTITYADAAADATIAGNVQLYTTGNVLQNAPANPLMGLIVHRNRIVGIDSTNPLSLWYSKQVIPGAPVEFSGFLTLNVDPRGGNCTALASMDDKLIVFKDGLVFGLTGQGPDATGGQSDFSDSQIISADVGCIAPKSIVLTPNGLMFQSRKGIYLLGRDLHVEYIGADVETYTTGTGSAVTSAVMVPGYQQVRFGVPGNALVGTLVYDYLMKQWSTFGSSFSSSGNSILNSTDATVWSNAYVTLAAGGVNQEVANQAFDSTNTFISLGFTTAPMAFAGIQGFQRVYKIMLITTYGGGVDPPLSIGLYYDYKSVGTIINGVSAQAAGSVPGQVRIFPSQQRCEAIQLAIDDTDAGGTRGLPTYDGLIFEFGVKPGAYRLPAAQSTG